MAAEDMTPEMKKKVSQHSKAIRYIAKRDGVPLPKAYNDYLSSASMSGSERSKVREKLGLSERTYQSDWRTDLSEYTTGSVADKFQVASKKPLKDTEAAKEIKPMKGQNKVLINPTMKEEIEEMGGIVLEEFEIEEGKEKLNIKTADMGEVVKDFYKSDAPQFKGKSKEKRREMAIAAKLNTETINYGTGMVKGVTNALKILKKQKKQKEMKD